MKKIPGPFEPEPFDKRPKRNMTARSYSCTTFMHKNNENGNVMAIIMIEMIVNRNAHIPGLAPMVPVFFEVIKLEQKTTI